MPTSTNSTGLDPRSSPSDASERDRMPRTASEAGDARDRLLEQPGERGSGERPDHDDKPCRHQRDEHPAGDVAALVLERVASRLAQSRERAIDVCDGCISLLSDLAVSRFRVEA